MINNPSLIEVGCKFKQLASVSDSMALDLKF